MYTNVHCRILDKYLYTYTLMTYNIVKIMLIENERYINYYKIHTKNHSHIMQKGKEK